ncbi:MAG: aminotransferase class I/II-fold pyridoxal phosphate-dependent enzyme, partial [Elusimicrobiota bacterium]
PKAMVKVNEVPILMNTLSILAKYGVKETIIVVGYKKEVIINTIGNNHNGMKVTYVVNDKYDKTNNIYSLWLAKDLVKENVLLIEGDIFFEEKLIEETIKDENQNLVLVDLYKPYMDGTVLEVNHQDNSIKQLIAKKAQGMDFDFSNKYKTINVYHFTKEFFNNFFVPNLETYIKTQALTQYYELILGVLVYIGYPKLYARIVDNIKWYEIDDRNDLEKAEYLFASETKKSQMINSIYGGYWRYDFLDFCYLYNLYFPTERIYNEIKHILPKLVSNYPSGANEIKKLIARWLNVPAQDVIVGNGASELIKLINRELVKKMTIPVPGFNEYERTLNSEQINYFHLAEDDFILEPEKYVKSVKDSKSNSALIINPNNPTGIYLEKDKIIFILKELKNLDMIIVDESFIDFVDKENVSLINNYQDFRNLIILKSLSKVYGIPGLRLGYALSKNKSFIEKITSELPIWNINSIAEYFLEILIKYQDEFKRSCKKIIDDRKNFIERLKKIQWLKIHLSSANYVFAKILSDRTSTEIKNILFEKHKALIKDCSNKKGLKEDKYIRITVRKPEENDILVNALSEI